MSTEKVEQDIDSLIGQLKDTAKNNNSLQEKAEDIGLNPSDVEDFVIQNSSKLVQRSLDAIDEVKDYIMASGDADSISALSELIRASSGALDSLNKIVVQNKRSATSLVVKGMDIDSRKRIEDTKSNSEAYVGTREEVFKKILAEAKVVDIDNGKDSNLDQ
jgi:hypothetical protein